jgi:hypothetical protein
MQANDSRTSLSFGSPSGVSQFAINQEDIGHSEVGRNRRRRMRTSLLPNVSAA